jgi:hypothetical protein
MFRKPISALLNRTHKISKEGIQTLPQQTQQRPETFEKKTVVQELKEAFDSVTLREHETSIRRDLDQRGLKNEQETIDILIRHLAAAQIARHFEFVNSSIWGSQINLLEHLNGSLEGELNENLRVFYDQAGLTPPISEEYPFERYLNFLILNNLIIQEEEKYKITNLGRDFLGYLVATGRTRPRPL